MALFYWLLGLDQGLIAWFLCFCVQAARVAAEREKEKERAALEKEKQQERDREAGAAASTQPTEPPKESGSSADAGSPGSSSDGKHSGLTGSSTPLFCLVAVACPIRWPIP